MFQHYFHSFMTHYSLPYNYYSWWLQLNMQYLWHQHSLTLLLWLVCRHTDQMLLHVLTVVCVELICKFQLKLLNKINKYIFLFGPMLANLYTIQDAWSSNVSQHRLQLMWLSISWKDGVIMINFYSNQVEGSNKLATKPWSYLADTLLYFMLCVIEAFTSICITSQFQHRCAHDQM